MDLPFSKDRHMRRNSEPLEYNQGRLEAEQGPAFLFVFPIRHTSNSRHRSEELATVDGVLSNAIMYQNKVNVKQTIAEIFNFF